MPLLPIRPVTKEFAFSRLARAAVFAFVVSVLLVGFTIVLIAYVWNNWVRDLFGMGTYQVQLFLIVPTILVVAGIVTKILWDNSQMDYEQRVRQPGEATWVERTTHAKEKDRRRYDPDPPVEEDKPVRSGPTGPSGYGAPSGGWDNPKLP